MGFDNISSLSEQELIEQIRLGNKIAINYLYECHWKMIKNKVLINSGNYEDAEDLYQEGILDVRDNIIYGKYNDRGDKLGGYIRKVCLNKWLKVLRDRKVKIEKLKIYKELDEINDTNINDDEETPYSKLLRIALDQISEKCKKLINLFYTLRKTHEEIAIELEFANANTCKATLNRCMDNAREIAAGILSDYYENEI